MNALTIYEHPCHECVAWTYAQHVQKERRDLEMHTLTHGCLCFDMSPFFAMICRIESFFDCQKFGTCNMNFSFFHLMHMLSQSFDMRLDFADECIHGKVAHEEQIVTCIRFV